MSSVVWPNRPSSAVFRALGSEATEEIIAGTVTRGRPALSSDDIVFEDIKYREPKKAPAARPRPSLGLPGL